MDINILREVVTVAAFLTFLGIVAFAVYPGNRQRFQEAAMLWMFTPRFFEIGAEVIDQMLQSFTAQGAPEVASTEGLLAQLDALGKHDVLERLPKIQVPTLVCGGKMDMMVPYLAQEEIAAAIPGARLVTFETGHGLMLEEMERFNSAIRSFLDELPGSY